MANLMIGVVIGALGMLIVQAVFDDALDWWADKVATARSWAVTVLGVCGFLFIMCVIAYAAGWRP